MHVLGEQQCRVGYVKLVVILKYFAFTPPNFYLILFMEHLIYLGQTLLAKLIIRIIAKGSNRASSYGTKILRLGVKLSRITKNFYSGNSFCNCFLIKKVLFRESILIIRCRLWQMFLWVIYGGSPFLFWWPDPWDI